MTQGDKILKALRRGGAMGVAQLSLATQLRSAVASRACSELIKAGLVSRVNSGGKGMPAVYALRNGAHAPVPMFRGEGAIKAEDDYVAARQAGRAARDISLEMGLTRNASDNFEEAFRSQTTAGDAGDKSCPQFAEHDRHLEAATRYRGGFPALAERAGRAVFPLTWPEARA